MMKSMLYFSARYLLAADASMKLSKNTEMATAFTALFNAERILASQCTDVAREII